MKNAVLILLIVAAALLTLFALIFAAVVFSRGPTGFEAMVPVLALVAAVTALIVTINGYRRVNRPKPPA